MTSFQGKIPLSNRSVQPEALPSAGWTRKHSFQNKNIPTNQQQANNGDPPQTASPQTSHQNNSIDARPALSTQLKEISLVKRRRILSPLSPLTPSLLTECHNGVVEKLRQLSSSNRWLNPDAIEREATKQGP